MKAADMSMLYDENKNDCRTILQKIRKFYTIIVVKINDNHDH